MTRFKGEILIVLCTLAWGLSYLFSKTALPSTGAINLVALRFIVACVVTALAFLPRTRQIGKPEIIFGSGLGTLLFGSSILVAVGLKSTTVSNAGFIIGSMILAVAILDTVVRKEKPRLKLILGVGLAVFGIGVLTIRADISANPGDLYCFGGMLLLSIHVMVAQQAVRNADPIGASIVQFAATGCLALTASVLTDNVFMIPRGEALLAVLALGVVGTAGGFVCQVIGQRFITPTRTAFIFTLEPVFATFFAWLFLGEPVTWHVYAGGGLLLAGVYVAEYDK